jgi:hypothetical protein
MQVVDFEELVVGCLLVNQGLGMEQVSLIADDFDSPWFRDA